MIKYLLIVAALTGCTDESEKCQELWDMTHAEKTPMTYAFAERCCDNGGKTGPCVKQLWKNSDVKEAQTNE